MEDGNDLEEKFEKVLFKLAEPEEEIGDEKTCEGNDFTYYDGDEYPWRGAVIAVGALAVIVLFGIVPWVVGAWNILAWIF